MEVAHESSKLGELSLLKGRTLGLKEALEIANRRDAFNMPYLGNYIANEISNLIDQVSATSKK